MHELITKKPPIEEEKSIERRTTLKPSSATIKNRNLPPINKHGKAPGSALLSAGISSAKEQEKDIYKKCINACMDQNLALVDEICIIFAEKGKTINEAVRESSLDRKNMLHICCQHQDPGLNVTKYLVESKQADANLKDKLGNSPILISCKTGNLEAVKYFESIGCDLNDMNSLGEYCMSFASTSGNLELVKYLAEKLVPLNLANIDGLTPLD